MVYDRTCPTDSNLAVSMVGFPLHKRRFSHCRVPSRCSHGLGRYPLNCVCECVGGGRLEGSGGGGAFSLLARIFFFLGGEVQ